MTEHPPPPEWVPYDVTLESDRSVFTDVVAFRATEPLTGSRKASGVVVVSRELLSDTGIDLERYIFDGLDRFMRPWMHPDRSSFPAIVLFPRWDALVRRLLGWRD